MTNLIGELKRRNVFRVGAAYLVVGWVALQAVDVVAPILELPDWFAKGILVLLAVGFPVAILLAWAYEVTPDGVRTTDEVDRDPTLSRSASRRLERVIAVAVILGLVFFIWDRQKPETAGALAAVDVSAPVPGFSGRAAIAVLPFVNMSDDPEQQYFADGMTEDIITGLQAFRSFPVIARTSTFVYKDVARDMRQIAQELGVGYIIEGSVRKGGDRVRITAQLITADGRHLWADNYDAPLDNLLTVEDEITRKIVNTIEPELLIAEATRVKYVRTEDLEAWDYYLRALAETTLLFGYTDLHGQPVTAERNNKARELALKAVELDPKFAKAYTLLTHIEANLGHIFRGAVSQEEARAAIERSIKYGMLARSISPFDATACSCLSWILVEEGEVETALEIQRAALEVNPSNSNLHAVYAWALLFDGQAERALEEIILAERLSPLDMGMTTYLGIEAIIHLELRDMETAARRALQATVLSPSNIDAQILRILALDQMGRGEEARGVFADLLAATPDFTVEALWKAPVPEVLVRDTDGRDSAASEGIGLANDYHEFVARRLRQLGWSS